MRVGFRRCGGVWFDEGGKGKKGGGEKGGEREEDGYVV